jgi:hypothetical protein
MAPRAAPLTSTLAHPTFMSLFALLFSRLQAHRCTTPVFIGSLRSVSEGRRSVRVSGQSFFSLAGRFSGFLSGAHPASGALFAYAFGLFQWHRSATPVLIGSPGGMLGGRRFMRVSGRSCFSLSSCGGGFLSGAQPSAAAPPRLALARTQHPSSSTTARFAQVLSRHLRHVTVAVIRHFVLQKHTVKTALTSTAWANPALNLAPFGHWTLRDKAAQRRLALR